MGSVGSAGSAGSRGIGTVSGLRSLSSRRWDVGVTILAKVDAKIREFPYLFGGLEHLEHLEPWICFKIFPIILGMS